jgi:uncharacterized protein with HEPN domain
MVEAIEGIDATAAGMTFAQYQQSWQVRRAVKGGIEIISEASRHASEELKLRYPHIYWREIAGIGNLLRHEYVGLTTGSCGAWSRSTSRS